MHRLPAGRKDMLKFTCAEPMSDLCTQFPQTLFSGFIGKSCLAVELFLLFQRQFTLHAGL